MLQENYRITNEEELQSVVSRIAGSKAYQEMHAVLVQVYTVGTRLEQAVSAIKLLRMKLTRAVVIGMSSMGGEGNKCERQQIWKPDAKLVSDPYIYINCCYFASSDITLKYISVDDVNDTEQQRKLALELAKIPELKGVEVFFAGLKLRVDDFLEQLSAKCPDVAFFGMGAGFNDFSDDKTDVKSYFSGYHVLRDAVREWQSNQYLSVQGMFFQDGVVLACMSGTELAVRMQYLFGWHPVGKYMTVSDVSDDNYVGKIDGIPAAQIYQKYIGVQPDEYFNMNIIEFPLVLERAGQVIGRIPMSVEERYDCIRFPSEIHEGDRLRFSYADPLEILEETHTASEQMRRLSPQAMFLFACGSRIIFLGDSASEEVRDYQRFCPQLSYHNGMGEIYKLGEQGGMLTGALVTVALWECDDFDACESQRIKEPVEKRKGVPQRIPLSARLAHFLKATTDDTENYAQEVEEQAAHAEAANKAKSQFLSNMSHEIRTPINAIMGLNEMILRECDDDTILSYAEDVQGAAQHLLGIVNDILDFSKIEAGKLEILPVEYSPSSVLNDIINMISSRAEKKGLDFLIDVATDIPSLLRGDEVRLKQVCMNILTNAVKYTEKGSVTFRSSIKKLDANHLLLRVEVEDTGIGIKEEDMPKLFTAFDCIEEKRNRTIEGTGLGMNITQRLLGMMGSALEVRSTYGKGSVFSFNLVQEVIDWTPLGDVEQGLKQAKTAQAERMKHGTSFVAPMARILVVDDTEMNLKVIVNLLKRTKIRVDTALSGQECLDMVQNVHYDMIFLDHRMPGMDGIETLHRLNAMNHLSQDAPIIALTANAISGAREQYMKAGFNEYLTKPIDSVKLDNILISYLPKDKVTRVKREKEQAPDLPQWMDDVPDVDKEAGCRNCGTPDAYLEAMEVFYDGLTDTIDTINAFYNAEDWHDYTIKVHALKSSARIIGAKKLSKLAERL